MAKRKQKRKVKKALRPFTKWCRKFLVAFSVSAVLYITWKLSEYFLSSGCPLFHKCAIMTFSLTGISSFVVYAVAEVIRFR